MTNEALTALTNDQLDARLAADLENEALWAERTRRIEARQAEIAADEQAWLEGIDALDAAEEVRTLRGLSDTAVNFIEEEHTCLEGALRGDRFESGRTFVRTTLRVWQAIEARFDEVDYADAIVCAAYITSDAGHELVERSAERSAKAMAKKLAKVTR